MCCPAVASQFDWYWDADADNVGHSILVPIFSVLEAFHLGLPQVKITK